MCEICLGHVWDMCEICLRHVWDLFETCVRFVWDMCEICLRRVRFVWDMCEICLRHVWDLFKTCVRFVWDMCEICLRHVWDLWTSKCFLIMHFRIYNFVTVKVKWNKSTIRHNKNLFLVKQNKQNILFVKTFRIDGALKCESKRFIWFQNLENIFTVFQTKGPVCSLKF